MLINTNKPCMLMGLIFGNISLCIFVYRYCSILTDIFLTVYILIPDLTRYNFVTKKYDNRPITNILLHTFIRVYINNEMTMTMTMTMFYQEDNNSNAHISRLIVVTSQLT